MSTFTSPNTRRAILAACTLIPFLATGCSSTGRLALSYGLHTCAQPQVATDSDDATVHTASLIEPGTPGDSHLHPTAQRPGHPAFYVDSTRRSVNTELIYSPSARVNKTAVEREDFTPADEPLGH